MTQAPWPESFTRKVSHLPGKSVTMAEVEERVRRLAEQTYDWMLETEQAALGWETPAGE